jgi:ribonucleoside-diphosphate reductase alpha chain
VFLGIHLDDLKSVIETYDLMSKKILYACNANIVQCWNAKTSNVFLFLLAMQDDSIDGIYDTLKQTAKISQSAGGIDFLFTTFEQQEVTIRGTNGTSNGIVPMLRVFNDTVRYVDQGGGKRKRKFAIYILKLGMLIF